MIVTDHSGNVKAKIGTLPDGTRGLVVRVPAGWAIGYLVQEQGTWAAYPDTTSVCQGHVCTPWYTTPQQALKALIIHRRLSCEFPS